MNKQQKPHINRSIWTMLFMVMWEFFCYFGVRALLVLYLTQKLGFSDNHAYATYGGFLALVFLTPTIGGWIADRWLRYDICVPFGALLLILGGFILMRPGINALYVGIASICWGAGFFKTNAISLLGNLNKQLDNPNTRVYTLYYISGNLGAAIAPIICAAMAKYFGWQIGFMTAGIGMSIGLIVYLLQLPQLRQMNPDLRKISTTKIISLIAFSIIAIASTAAVLIYQVTGIVLTITILLILPRLIHILVHRSGTSKRAMINIVIMTLFATLFWVFDQQNGSSISLFILREVNHSMRVFHHTINIPVPTFQALNPLSILLAGALIVFFICNRRKRQQYLNLMCLGFLLLCSGFLAIYLSTLTPINCAVSTWPVILSLSLVGMAELFIDPVVLAAINRDAPDHTTSFLTGVYYLFVGAIANYGSGWVARWSSVPAHASRLVGRDAYQQAFGHMLVISLVALITLTLYSVISRATR